ncbi:hypothetical protein ACLOJK_034644 [Asimina triloba]
MAPRKVMCTSSISETRGEQSVLPQYEEGGSLPPQDSLDDVAANSANLPLAASPVAPKLLEPGAINSQLSPLLQPQQQQPAAHAQIDTPSSTPPAVLILMPSPTTTPLTSIGAPAPLAEYLRTWGASRYVRIEETGALHLTADSALMAPMGAARPIQGSA